MSVLLFACALAGPPALQGRTVPASPQGWSDHKAYDTATGGAFSTLLPVQHVAFADVSGVPKGADGCFRPGSGTIIIRLRGGTLPAADYVSILRHEYGHALLYEWSIAAGYGVEGFESALADRLTAACAVPRPLAGLESEFRAEPWRFGTYARVSLGEWLAEAYASYVSRDGPLPERTRAFFDALTDQGRAP